MTTYNITEAQLNELCAAVANGTANTGDEVQTTTFLTGEIVRGVREGLSPEEIADKCYKSVINNPARANEYFVRSGIDSHFNEIQYSSTLAKKLLEAYVAE